MGELIPSWCLAVATLLGECGNEPYLGKLAVAKTIRNRMRLGYSSDRTVAGTVLRPLQFSMWNSKDKGRIRACNALLDDPKTQDAKKAWEESEAPIPALGKAFDSVVLYHATYVQPKWAPKVKRVRQIGLHVFYIDQQWMRAMERAGKLAR